MSEKTYRKGTYENYKPDPRTYGGEITLFDFEGHATMTDIADKIRRSESFDKTCCNNLKIRYGDFARYE
jgi:hypothetical protein